MSKILIVDDEENIVNLIKYPLEKEGYEVYRAFDGYEATEKINSVKPDIILLDIMMPNKDGYQVCREFGDRYPIIMITAKNDITDKIAGIELGADDYITKPFDIREVVIRVKALLRRKDKSGGQIISIGEISIIPNERRIILENKHLPLTPIEYGLILTLIETPNKVFTREELLDKVWGYEYIGETRSVDIHIQRLRKKLGTYSKYINTVYGVGYQWMGV